MLVNSRNPVTGRKVPQELDPFRCTQLAVMRAPLPVLVEEEGEEEEAGRQRGGSGPLSIACVYICVGVSTSSIRTFGLVLLPACRLGCNFSTFEEV